MENTNSLHTLRREFLHSEIPEKPEIEIRKIITFKMGNTLDIFTFFYPQADVGI